jgi:hypothetical protein
VSVNEKAAAARSAAGVPAAGARVAGGPGRRDAAPRTLPCPAGMRRHGAVQRPLRVPEQLPEQGIPTRRQADMDDEQEHDHNALQQVREFAPLSPPSLTLELSSTSNGRALQYWLHGSSLDCRLGNC